MHVSATFIEFSFIISHLALLASGAENTCKLSFNTEDSSDECGGESSRSVLVSAMEDEISAADEKTAENMRHLNEIRDMVEKERANFINEKKLEVRIWNESDYKYHSKKYPVDLCRIVFDHMVTLCLPKHSFNKMIRHKHPLESFKIWESDMMMTFDENYIALLDKIGRQARVARAKAIEAANIDEKTKMEYASVPPMVFVDIADGVRAYVLRLANLGNKVWVVSPSRETLVHMYASGMLSGSNGNMTLVQNAVYMGSFKDAVIRMDGPDLEYPRSAPTLMQSLRQDGIDRIEDEESDDDTFLNVEMSDAVSLDRLIQEIELNVTGDVDIPDEFKPRYALIFNLGQYQTMDAVQLGAIQKSLILGLSSQRYSYVIMECAESYEMTKLSRKMRTSTLDLLRRLGYAAFMPVGHAQFHLWRELDSDELERISGPNPSGHNTYDDEESAPRETIIWQNARLSGNEFLTDMSSGIYDGIRF